MTAPAITAPAPTAPAAPVAPAVEQIQQQPTQQPTVPVAPTSRQGNPLERMIQNVGRKMTPEGQAFVTAAQATESHPMQGQGLDANAILAELTGSAIAPAAAAVPDGTQAVAPPADGSVPPVATDPTAPPAEPSQVMEVVVQDADGQDYTFRARDPKTGQFAPMDVDRVFEWEGGKDKVTGEVKVYRKSMKEMQRLAVDGIAMQKSREELNYYRQNAPEWQKGHQQLEQKVTQAQSEAQQLRNLVHQLLTEDETWVVSEREKYAKQFTPEQQMARLQNRIAELESGRNIPQQTQPPARPAVDPQVQQMVGGFVQRTAPILEQVGQMVGEEAATGKFVRFTTPLLVNGQIPPHRLAEVEAFVQGPYLQWAQEQAASKTNATQELERARAQAAAIQARAQAAANQVGAAQRPAGGLPSNAPVQLPPARNREEAIHRIATGAKHQGQMAR